jgi:hypothetical protein
VTAQDYLESQTVRCRCCEEDIQATEVTVTSQARRDPDDRELITCAKTVSVTANCQTCIEETTLGLLL